MRRLIAGTGWKLNNTVAETRRYAAAISSWATGKALSDIDIFVLPPFTSLHAARTAFADTPIAIGGQNMHWQDAGAWTGEISAPMLREAGCRYVELAHSERLQFFGETYACVRLKVDKALAAGLTPIICLGETQKEKAAGRADTVLQEQLLTALTGQASARIPDVVLAYEPRWAIGSAEAASPDYIAARHGALREILRKYYGAEVAEETRIIYGGSVTPKNGKAILEIIDVDGLFVGRAAWKAEGFIRIIDLVRQAAHHREALADRLAREKEAVEALQNPITLLAPTTQRTQRRNPMTCIHDDPEVFATTALAGFASANSRQVRLITGGVVRATATPQGKVALVVGGGSGHYPAFAGFVGPGMADAAVAGDIFASPSAHSVAHVSRMANRGGGILLGFGKYAGDMMNFGLAAERLQSEGVDVRIMAVTDDVASGPADKPELRRGVAGDLVVFKIAGAAAEAGLNLDEVERLARKANASTVTFGVAFTGCTLPGAEQPLFTVPPKRMGVGLGIHGEPGISEEDILPAKALAEKLVSRLVAEKPATASGRVAVILNGLGCTKYEELFVLWVSVEAALKNAGLTPVMPEVGEFVTSLDMAGCSLTLAWLDEELEEYWCAPSDTPVLRRGNIIPTQPAEPLSETPPETTHFPEAAAPSHESAQCVAKLIDEIANAMHEAENTLGKIDAQAGDGDHGMGMARGSSAAAEAAAKAVAAGAGLASTLATAGDAWADRAGGTSGALWGLMLRTWSTAFSDQQALDAAAVVKGAQMALDAVKRLGRAQVGDKTLVDAFEPFVTLLATEIGKGTTLKTAWQNAAQTATVAAEATAQLAPKLGRARSHTQRSLGHPDAGAVSLAICACIVGKNLT